MEITKQEKVTEFKEIVVAIKCDSCKKKEVEPEDWLHFSSEHSNWGNDSVDSYKSWDVCSPKCYIQKLIQLAKDNQYADTFEANSMNHPFLKRFINETKKQLND